jgi:glycosyltransferase involved in cell wall biosynthesis
MKKIAYIRIFPAAYIGRSVARMLADSFPEYEVETISIAELLRRRPDILFISSIYTIKEYWRAILTGRKTFRKSFEGTTYVFEQVKRLVTERLSDHQRDYIFSFQLQSLFDASFPGLPHYVYTDHTHLANLEYPQFDRKKLHSPAWIQLEESIYANARRIFTRSTNITRSLARDYGCPPEKTMCVYVGVNVRGSDYTTKAVSKEGQNILFVGIDWERKGGPELVEAFKQVLEFYPHARLTIIGCNPEINLPNCLVLGRLPVEEVQRYYASASIFCLPTKLEPFGVVFVEAMANGLPIVATDIGAIPDFVQDGENGYLVAPGQVDELAEALIDLLGNPEKRRLFGMRSLALAMDRYNWKSVGRTIRECILADLDQLPLST